MNPVGGKGKAVHIYRSQIQPLFEVAEAECEVVITGNNNNKHKMMSLLLYTEYAGHAQSLVKTFDLSSIDAIVMAAGDGLLYEVR